MTTRRGESSYGDATWRPPDQSACAVCDACDVDGEDNMRQTDERLGNLFNDTHIPKPFPKQTLHSLLLLPSITLYVNSVIAQL